MSKMLILKQLSCALVVSLVTTPLLPVAVQANIYRVSCQTTVSLGQGRSLIYQLAGTLPQPTTEAIPQNAIGTSLTLTVQSRDQNGRVQTLLNGSALRDYAELAPDADYSQVPFEGSFRGQPNNGDRLYRAPASAHGLYVSLRPRGARPQQMQVVHYLNARDYVRSAAGACQT